MHVYETIESRSSPTDDASYAVCRFGRSHFVGMGWRCGKDKRLRSTALPVMMRKNSPSRIKLETRQHVLGMSFER